ncbi:tetratricopeptide repeat protein [uncultured Flavobacterium sp.]|uniref:tetratricopeptide repeat protein n=1 Tax=uncultured Flavobacterium sp. TaxID=165435 RepID=UPI0025DA94B1|nr:tetratricopeptide repeat protein [uncultured Flavobacterium sp.]
MNSNLYISLLNRPDAVSDKHTLALEKIMEEFPYFQSARALYLKGLYNQNSFKYNSELKITAAHTTDRSILFEFITSQNFMAIQKAFFDEKEAKINDIKVHGMEIIRPEPEVVAEEPKVDALEQSILTSIKEATPTEEKITTEIKEETASETATQKLEIGKPLDFSSEEKHSFQEWLQLASFKPISREENASEKEKTEEISENDLEKKKKIEIIDKFIEANPKISPVKNTPISVVPERSSSDTSYLMTETLAKVYLEQKKYHKAIQAYEILILKYPEKNHFFADRILDIKILQQSNNN